ncbi:MAG: putative cytochrome hydroxylase [Frankiales bacterium]|jgi:cytochrome P450|nr:putative cytochrome hydroxylase [Frankiales bacterium]
MTTSASCPVAHDFDPLDDAFLTDPFPRLAELRSEGPVVYHPDYDLYFLTRYDDIEQVLLDRDTFAAANASSPVFPPCPAAVKVLSAVKRVPTLTNADPPRHAPMRRAVQNNLTPKRLTALEPIMRAQSRRMIEAFKDSPTADLVSQLAFPLPAYAGFTLLGFPEDDWEMLKAWCSKRILMTYGRLPEEDQVAVAENVVAFWKYCEEHVAHREAEPGNDFTTDLLAWRAEHPDEVSFNDAVSIVYSIALAGHDSTTNLFTNGLRYLLANQDAWKAIVADPSLIPNAVEEMLRFDPPILGWRRITTTETEVGGVTLPKGAQLFMTFASAHRDADKFPEPDTFDISRDNARSHLSFGKGVHLCIGAPLARLEMRVTLENLIELTPNLKLVDEQAFAIVPNLVFRQMEELLVETGA